MTEGITIHLSREEALVLFEFFARFDQDDLFRLRNNSEFVAFMKIAGQLENELVEPFQENYSELLVNAQTLLAAGYEGLAPGVEPEDNNLPCHNTAIISHPKLRPTSASSGTLQQPAPPFVSTPLKLDASCKMPDDLKSFVGTSLRSVENRDWSWFFRFDAPLLIATESPWRFLIPGRIKVTSEDHGHPFGLPQPVDAVERVMSRLAGLHVQAVSCDATTGDLFVSFGDGLCLQFLQISCGYESWRATTEHGESICLGGGERIEFIPNTKNS